MTKRRIYVKIIIMKVQMSKKIKNYLVALLFIVLCFCVAGFYTNTMFSKAQDVQISNATFLPQTDLENTALISPIDVYHDQDVTAIADDTQQLFIHHNGSWFLPLTDFQAIKQVKKLNDTTLLVSNSGSIYSIDLTQLSTSPASAKSPLSDGSNIIGGNFFDINDNFLVTTYSTVCLVYNQSQSGFDFFDTFAVKDSTPVAINKNNQIFFVDNNGIAIYETITGNYSSLCKGVFPSKMIADNNFIYYIDGIDLFMLSTAGGQPVKLNKSNIDDDFDLGVIENPIAISFKGYNLLITDKDTIQEYKIENNTLIFTGFAIASGKTAYNRVSKNATEIEKTNNSVAVLDSYKLTVFTGADSQNRYARENYKNYLVSELVKDSVLPSSFALGEQNALLLYNSSSANKFVALLDFSKQENFLIEQPYLGDHSVIHDVCYQSGYYYLLCDNGTDAQHIYRAKADAESLNFVKIDQNQSTARFTMFTVDTYSNVYLANQKTVAKLSVSDGYSELIEVGNSFTKITKLQTDLLGRLYVVDDGNIKSIENSTVTDYSLPKVKSFAFDFVNSDAFMIYNGSEFIYQTTALDNVSITDLVVPDDFNLSSNPNSPNIADENLQFFRATEGANVYVIKDKNLEKGQNFEFDGLSSYTGEFVKICTITYNGEPKFYALAYQDLISQDCIVLLDISQAQDTNKQIDEIDKTVYIATDVNCYFLPIITPTDRFALNKNQVLVRLSKTTPISVKKKLSFLDNDYYYAEFLLAETTYIGYIPCDFTVDVLTDEFEWEQFSIETVKNTWVYKQSDMQEKAFELKKDSTIRLIEKGDKVCKIAYKNGNEWEIRYIYTSKIIDQPALAIRNVLIILAVVACLCGTTTYFLLRNKKESNNKD